MKITSGLYKGIPISAPKGEDIRPTLAKTRSAIFNMLRPVINSTICLDFFAGTGAFGLEALSNGASKAVFIDTNHREAILKNTAKLKIPKTCFEIIKADYKDAMNIIKSNGIKADIVFADPPYNKGYIKNFLKLSYLNDNLLNALIVIEMHRDERKECSEELKGWKIVKEKEYGETSVLIIKRGG